MGHTTRRFAVTALALAGIALGAMPMAQAQTGGLPPLPDSIKKQGLVRIGFVTAPDE
jgi:ABC-type sugar transport system substrate-binding protein